MKIYVRSNSSDYAGNCANIWHIDFYEMVGDLRPLKEVYIFAESKQEAKSIAKKLAVALGYNPDKTITQYAYMTIAHLDRYYEPREADGIRYFIKQV